LTFATIMTQLLARYTTLLDGRKTVKMTGRVYLRAIVPIGFFFSLSLICGNLTYLYLSVAFIQMLKATTPVAVLLSSWALGVSQPNLKIFLNVSAIVVGVIIASIGEIKFVWIGFIYQIAGIIFEALRLTMVQRLLSSAEFKMDPLVSLYYFAPVCAIMNGVVALFWEVPKVSMSEVYNVGLFTFFLNGLCAFLLNVSVVFLIGKTSSLVLTLCGVLKDVLLVVASMIIWGTQVTALQFFGYSIALGGMIYYKLGYEAIKGYAGEAGRQWADFGNRRPVLRRVAVILLALMTVFVVLGGVAPSYDATQVLDQAKNKMGLSKL
jgi:drug/metabolite transporter (DMT)-like permease